MLSHKFICLVFMFPLTKYICTVVRNQMSISKTSMMKLMTMLFVLASLNLVTSHR